MAGAALTATPPGRLNRGHAEADEAGPQAFRIHVPQPYSIIKTPVDPRPQASSPEQFAV